MSEHTPGPWTWTDDDFADRSPGRDAAEPTWAEKRLDLKDADSANVMLTGESRAVLIPWDYEGYRAGVYIREADARLIAAAPRLLDELKWIEAFFYREGTYTAIQERCREAIEETEHGSP